jgi:hypothetical protein
VNIGNSPADNILKLYRELIAKTYPAKAAVWPLRSFGLKLHYFWYKNWHIIHVVDRISLHLEHDGGGELPEGVVGVPEITEENKERVRERLSEHFRIAPRDGMILVDVSGKVQPNTVSELEAMRRQHEIAMGLAPMKVFLSHKGADKEMVRRFTQTLSILGFDPWLDEEAMPAGTPLHRGILKWLKESCAAIFFITVNFRDESYLSAEVDYAIEEKTRKGEKFSIITLVIIEHDGRKGVVPELLKRYVWKEVRHEIVALQEIIKALPLKLGAVSLK